MTQDLRELHGKEYVERFEMQQSQHRIGRLIDLMELQADMRVADFGCGNGMITPLIAQQVSEYYGVDFSPEFIKAANKNTARRNIKNATFFCQDIIEFCSEHKNSFDAAFALDFSEHVPDQEWVEILSSMRQNLKPGGSLYLHTPNKTFFIELMKEHDLILKQFPEHVAVRTIKENSDLIKDAGFTKVDVKTLPHYNILKLVAPLSFLPLIGKFFEARIFIRAIA